MAWQGFLFVVESLISQPSWLEEGGGVARWGGGRATGVLRPAPPPQIAWLITMLWSTKNRLIHQKFLFSARVEFSTFF